MKILLAALLVCSCASTPLDGVKGWVVTGVNYAGGCTYRPFMKTGVTNEDDLGNPQIKGYSEGGPEVVLEANFLLPNQAKVVGPTMCKAPSVW